MNNPAHLSFSTGHSAVLAGQKTTRAILLAAIFLLIPYTFAAPIASDSFDVSTGGADYSISGLAGQSATVGTSGYAPSSSWSTGTGAFRVVATGLSHPLTPGSVSDGQVIAFTGTGSAERRLVRAINYTPTDGSYFFSALFRKTAATSNRDMLAGLGPSEGATSSFSSSQATYMGIWNGGFQFSAGGNSFTELLTPAQMNVNETYFGLMEISYSTTGSDSVTVKVYDASSALVANQTFNGLDLDGDISRLSLATRDFAPTVGVDEWRFGTTLADVQGALGPPTLASGDIVDDQGGNPVVQGALVNYTVTFSQDMDDATVDASDFGNAGSATFSIGSIAETSPGVFSLPVTPTSDGTLRLQVNQSAVLSNGNGNLDTSSAILDDTTITVTLTDIIDPTISSSDFVDDESGGPVGLGVVVTYAVTFSEDMDDTTVDASDFGVTGMAGATIGAVTETSPGVFSVSVTTNSVGTMQLRINQSAILSDLGGNELDTSAAILDDTIIAVADIEPGLVAYYPFDNDLNDASGNGSHGSLTDGGTAGNSGITNTAGEFVFGGGAYFNAEQGDFIDIPDQDFSNGDSWSISIWSKRINNDGHGMLIGSRTDTKNFLWHTSNQQGLRIRNDASSTKDIAAPKDTVWHHWVFVADGTAGNVTVYLDNAVLAPAFNYNTAFKFREIADAYAGLNLAFVGQIDEVYIYNTPIDSTKVAELYTGGEDEAAPTLTSIVDDRAGGPVEPGSVVTYTVTLDEDMDDVTVTAADFGNAGSIASFSIGTVTETSPGIFSVPVTPNTTGTLRLQINQGAVLSDLAGNDLDTASAILDDTTITVEIDNIDPTLAMDDIQEDQGGGAVIQGTTVTYTITFSEDIDESTVTTADFGNNGTATITIGSITEVTPGVFEVQVTPDTTGTLQLKVLSGTEITDAAGNPLDTTSDILSDTVITVVAGFDPNAVQTLKVVFVAGQSNADGRAPTSGLPTSPVNLQLPQDDVDFMRRVEGTIHPLTTLRPGLSETGGFGPEVSLGRYLADEIADGLTTRVAVIKYANGGTNLHTQWAAGGDATTGSDGSQYVRFQETVTAGLAALATEYPNADIDLMGLVWVQGESDGPPNDANYQTNLTNFIADLRLTYHADLPFIVVRVGNTIVRAAQTTVAAGDPQAGLVDTDGFSKQDSVHFDASGQQDIGDASAILILDLNSPISVSSISGETNEAGGTATFTVVLDSQPTDDVTIGISSDNTDEGTISPSSLTFTDGNWDTPQTVTVTGVDDALIDGDVAYNIVTAAATSVDPDFDGINPADVVVINTDDDAPPAGQPIAYYSFDSDFTDGSGNGNNLSVANGTPNITTAAGETAFGGGALNLENSSGEYLNLSTVMSFEANEAWSVSFWAKRRAGASDDSGMVMGENGVNGGFIWNTANSSQVVGLRFRPSSVATGAGNNDFAVGTNTAYNHHVIVADGGGNLSYYYNNVSQGMIAASPDTDFDITSIGNAYSGTSLTFDGQLDEIYIYDEAIGAAKVAELWGGGIPTPHDIWIDGFDFSGFTNPDLTPTGNPDGDVYNNLLERAFGFDPTVSDGSGPLVITNPGASGTITQNGPPQIHTDPVTGRFFLHYTRRADHAIAGLAYTAQFASNSLGAGAFEDMVGGSVVATGTGAGGVALEAVAIEFPDALPTSGRKARFGRVEVTQTP